MIIKKAVLHIMDFNSNVSVFSQKELDFSDGEINTFIEKHIEHIHKDTSKRDGEFLPESEFKSHFGEYTRNEIDFMTLSMWVANFAHDQIAKSEELENIDFLAVDYIYDDTTYYAVMLLANKTSFTHEVKNDEGVIYNNLILHRAILPNVNQRVSSFFFINCENYAINFADKKRSVDGHSILLLPELVLQCSQQISSKEAVKIVKAVTQKVAEEYGENSVVAVSKAKNFILQNSEESEVLSPVKLGQEVFSESTIMQDAFEKKIMEKEISQDVKIEHDVAVKSVKSHKIKTDTGIELSFPAEYFANQKFIEFINNPDGTISIELKNIGKIINK